MMKISLANRITIWILAVLFLTSGVLHLVNPGAFLWLMPPWLPEHNLLILASGVFEVLCAIGLIAKQKWAGYLSALVLLAIWPANIWYAFDVSSQGLNSQAVIAWLRLPLQIPLIYAAIKFARSSKPTD
jgi:uncharacterized membrane protein